MELREKVIEGLESCSVSKLHDKCDKCPYCSSCGTEGGSFAEIAHDALKLLTNQKLVTVIDMILGIDGWGGCCPVCGSFLLEHHNKHFCGNCGQAVKWND